VTGVVAAESLWLALKQGRGTAAAEAAEGEMKVGHMAEVRMQMQGVTTGALKAAVLSAGIWAGRLIGLPVEAMGEVAASDQLWMRLMAEEMKALEMQEVLATEGCGM